MNDFDRKLKDVCAGGLQSCDIEVVQVNVGLLCNQSCAHDRSP